MRLLSCKVPCRKLQTSSQNIAAGQARTYIYIYIYVGSHAVYALSILLHLRYIFGMDKRINLFYHVVQK